MLVVWTYSLAIRRIVDSPRIAAKRSGVFLSPLLLYRHLIRRQVPCQNFFCLYNAGMDTKRGRPPKADDERRHIRYQIRLSQTELELLERAAQGKTSTWARETLLAAARRRAQR